MSHFTLKCQASLKYLVYQHLFVQKWGIFDQNSYLEHTKEKHRLVLKETQLRSFYVGKA